MSGVFWLVFTWGAIAIFVIGIVCRILAIARLPIHLRWELAPIPHEKAKGSYGGSYLEEYEWWKAERKTSAIAPLLYMGEEIFLMRSVWKHNRSLWPFPFTMHWGIYLFTVALLGHVVLAAISDMDPRLAPSKTCLEIISVIALCSYLLGAAGTVGLLLKRIIDPNLRWSNDTGTLLNLLFLAALFVSGGYAWLGSANGPREIELFVRGILSFDGSLRIAFPLALHVTLLLLFCVYIPFTSMIHFAAKYFTYHRVVWNDEPLNEKMERELEGLLSQPVDWKANHAGAGGRGSWAEVVKEGIGNEKTQP